MATAKRFVVCISNSGYEVSLERRKLYELRRDENAEKEGLVRVVDESGDDYLYPEEFFLPIDLTQPLRRAILAAG